MRFIFIAAVGLTLAACAKEHGRSGNDAPAPRPSEAARPAEVSALGACVKSMCPYTTQQLARPRPPGHALRIEGDLKNVLEPLVNEQIEQARNSRAYRQLIDVFPTVSFEGVTLSDDVRVILNLFHTFGAINELEVRGLVEPNPKTGRMEFDHARAITQWRMNPAFTDADEALAKAGEQIVNSPEYRVLDLRDNLTLSWLYRQNATKKLTYRRFIKEVFEELKRNEALVARTFPYLERPKSELMRRYESGQVISDPDTPALIGEVGFYGMAAEALTDNEHRTALLAIKRDYVTEAYRAWRGIKERNINDRAWEPEEVRNYCVVKFRAKLESFPTRAEIQAFDRAERVPTQSIAVAALRDLGLTEGANRLLTAAVNYPSPYGRALKQITEDLRTIGAFRLAQAARLNHLTQILPAGSPAARAELLALFAGNAIGDPQEINAVYGACDEVEPTPMRDSTYDTEISISWQILLRQMSARTLAHEMGHTAFFAYGEEQRPPVLNQQIACLQRRHRGLEANPSHYVIEDYADLVANEVTRRLDDRRPLSLCEYISEESASVAQPPEERDTHSSNLFRLLVIAGDNRPPRCEAVVREAGATNLAEPCWRPAAAAADPPSVK